MNFRRLLTAVALGVAVSVPASADEALNKLLAGHEQAVRAARLPIHRKLLGELQKLEAVHQKSGNRIALNEVQTEIAKVKQCMADAAQPVAGSAGPQPGDFKLIYSTGGERVFGSWDNGELKTLPKGFSWNNRGEAVDITHTTVLTGAFEAEFTYKGTIYTLSLSEADYVKYVQLYYPGPEDDAKHTLKVKRTAAGAITAELDGKPFTYQATPGARPDMHLRFNFRVLKDKTVEFRETAVKDFSGGKK